MKVHGALDLLANPVKNFRLGSTDGFPTNPQPGTFYFNEASEILYFCLSAGGLPVWAPLIKVRTMYRHDQTTPALEWTIEHGLNTALAIVQVFDADGESVIPDKIFCDQLNTATVRFNTPFAGKAIVVSGEVDGHASAPVAYSQSFTSSTTWVINHALGYNPRISVFVGNEEVQPSSIVHDSTTQATVTFIGATAGYVRCY